MSLCREDEVGEVAHFSIANVPAHALTVPSYGLHVVDVVVGFTSVSILVAASRRALTSASPNPSPPLLMRRSFLLALPRLVVSGVAR